MEFRFSHREKFRDYMQSVIPEVTYQPEAVLLSVNALRKDKVETSYVHISRLGGFSPRNMKASKGRFMMDYIYPLKRLQRRQFMNKN